MALAKRRPVEAEDLYRFEIISEPQISPEGESAVFVVHRVDRKTEKKRANLWVVSTRGGPARPFTQGDHADTYPRFSPDGRTVAFLSNRGNERQPQIYLLPTSGGEASRLTDLEGTIQSFGWSPDGKRLVLQFRRKDEAEIAQEKDPRRKELGLVSRRITRVFFKEDGVGFLPQDRWHLWSIDARTGKAEQLTESEVFDDRDPAWSPDGKEIAFVSNHAPDPDLDPDAIDLFVLRLSDRKVRKVATPAGPKGLPSFSPDGKWIAYVGREGKDEDWKAMRLWIVPARGEGKPECLTRGIDVHVSAWTINDMGSLPQVPPTWSRDGRRIFFQIAHHGETRLVSIDLDLQPRRLAEIVSGPGVVGAFTFDRAEERLLYFYGTMADPGQVFLRNLRTGKTRKLTKVNEPLLRRLDLGKVEEVWFKGPAGNDLQGWILTPPGFDPKRKYPSILEIHGGPRTQYGHFFMHEFYFLAGKGYVVCFSNPRGGTGYGEAHTKAIWNAWGTADYDDLMAFTDLVTKRPSIDRKRMGVTGGSYGGYMVNWIIGHTHRFAAAATQRCVSNFISMYGSSDFNWAFEKELSKKPPWDDLETYWRQSPMAHIGSAKTPTLVLHNEQDLRCAIEQGEQVFVALKRLGVPTEMVRFPDEPHGLSRVGRTDRRIARLEAIAGWFDRYLKG